MKNHFSDQLCPCESGKPYQACCEPFHNGTPAPTAEKLMRSRYCAFVLGLEAYLLKTWHPNTRPAALNLADDPPTKWLGLEIKHAEITGENTAIVEFVARYKTAGKATSLHETSLFERTDGRWYYLSVDFSA